MSELAKILASEFADKEYAHAYMEGHSVTRLAAQIHALRKDRNWTQKELAKKAGMSQARVSKYESGDFESVTLSTLQKLSQAFDIHAMIDFVPFSNAVLDVVNLDPEDLVVSSREQCLAQMVEDQELTYMCNQWISVMPNPFKGSGKKEAATVKFELGRELLAVGG